MTKLLYRGLKVKIPNITQHIHTSLQDSYFRNGFLFIKRIDENNNCAYVSYAPRGFMEEKISIEYIEPIYDRDLHDVLKEKTVEFLILKNEIKQINQALTKKTTK